MLVLCDSNAAAVQCIIAPSEIRSAISTTAVVATKAHPDHDLTAFLGPIHREDVLHFCRSLLHLSQRGLHIDPDCLTARAFPQTVEHGADVVHSDPTSKSATVHERHVVQRAQSQVRQKWMQPRRYTSRQEPHLTLRRVFD
jgi:hypothetical protein